MAFSADQVADILQHLVEIEVDVLDRQLAGLDLREIENVVDDAQQVLAGALDLPHVVALRGVEVGLQGRCDMPMMAFIGVRISWLMLARKMLLASLASSAASVAFLSSVCAA